VDSSSSEECYSEGVVILRIMFDLIYTKLSLMVREAHHKGRVLTYAAGFCRGMSAS
jgi:hypothetical protein